MSYLRVAALAGVALLVVVGAALVSRWFNPSQLPYLSPEGDAQWIQFRNPEIEVYIGDGTFVTGFRKRFMLAQPVAGPSLTFRAMKSAEVLLDGQRIAATDPGTPWNQSRTVPLPNPVPQGAHELLIVVTTRNGPQCLLAYSQTLGLATDESWEASRDARAWTPAIPVDAPHTYAVARRFPRADKVLVSLLPVLVPVFLVTVLGYAWWSAQARPTPVALRPNVIRWLVLTAWLAMGLNNLAKLPDGLGFDIEGHIEYLRAVATHWRIPLATEGWTMFQAPLFYILCAPPYRALLLVCTDETALRVLRIVPLLCGAAQIELCYRTVRLIWPQRHDLQILGTVLGGLLPLHTYIAQFLGNEPLSGLFTGLVILLSLRCLVTGPSTRLLILLGVSLGAALLSKVTAVLLLPPVALVLAMSPGATGDASTHPTMKVAKRWLYVFSIVLVLSGWYYLRNCLILGRPFYGGWESERGIIWWQDPGYRTLQQFTTFGTALFYPVCANMCGFWDGLYSTFWTDGLLSAALDYANRPPWNYDFMSAGVWLGVAPTLAMFVGAARIFTTRGTKQQILAFAAVCVALYVTGILYTFATVPYYCVVKASYMTGLLPCFAVLGAEGFDVLGRFSAMRAVMYGIIACWAVAAYAAYFVW